MILSEAKIGSIVKIKWNNRKYRVVSDAGTVCVGIVGIQRNTNSNIKGFNGTTEIEVID